MANDAQAWKKKPAPFGGQASVATPTQVATGKDYTGLTFPLIGYSGATATTYSNLNGSFTLSDVGANGATFTGVNGTEKNTIVVKVCGVSDKNIAGSITILGGQTANADPTCTGT